ncbi:hypothetical protein [Nocardia sp. NPDC049149]|uniref:hypothetical protein n=1 Tax=Nocardia sp. NPDC049149 TaxID=3364315 RepID=UPI00371CD6AC
MRVDKQAVGEVAAVVGFILSAVIASAPHPCAEVIGATSAVDQQAPGVIPLTPERATTITR